MSASMQTTNANTPTKYDKKIRLLAYCIKVMLIRVRHTNRVHACLDDGWRSLPINSEALSSQRSTRAAFTLPCKSRPLRRLQVEPAPRFYGRSICSGFSVF